MNAVLKKTTSLVLIASLALGITFTGSDVSYAKKKAKKPAKVASLKVKANKAKISVSWKKARKYQVYMKTASGKWKRYKTVTKNKLTYTAKENATFSFRVRGINGKRKGRFSKARKVTISCVPAIKVNTKNIEVEQGDSFTVKVSGYAAANASWSFDSSFLKANTKSGDRKTFTTREAGSTVITVTDENGENDKKVYVTVDEVSEEDEKPKQDKETVDFAIDGPSEITVMEGEEFTLKIKGKYADIACWSCDNTYINKTEEYDGWKNDDESILNSDCTPVCKFKAVCPGTTTIEARSKTAIGKRLKEVYFIINVESAVKEVPEEQKTELYVINPENLTVNNGYHQALYIKTKLQENQFECWSSEADKAPEEGDYVAYPNAYGKKINTITEYDDIVYSNTQTVSSKDEKTVGIEPINSQVYGGYVYSFVSNTPGSYKVFAYNPETKLVLGVSDSITVVSVDDKEINKKRLLSRINNDMTQAEKYEAMLYFIQWYCRYPMFHKESEKTINPIFTDARNSFNPEDRFYPPSVKRYYGSYVKLSTQSMHNWAAEGIMDSAYWPNIFADCCEECGMVVVSRKIHDVQIQIKGETEPRHCNPCPGYGIGYVDCTNLDEIAAHTSSITPEAFRRG